jgi:hypothetical protein
MDKQGVVCLDYYDAVSSREECFRPSAVDYLAAAEEDNRLVALQRLLEFDLEIDQFH